MTVRADLFQLIYVLTKNEKRRFQAFASKHVIGKENNYIALFDAIRSQKAYDEDAIKQLFKGKNLISRISSEKVYLHNLEMKSLPVYHSRSSIDAKLNAHLHDVGILFNKALYKQCRKMLNRAWKLAEKNDRYLNSTIFKKPVDLCQKTSFFNSREPHPLSTLTDH